MKQVMSWNEWQQYDGLGLAELIRNGKITAQEVAQQVKQGVEKVNPDISAVIEVCDEAAENPATDGTNLQGPFAGLPFFMKDLGPTVKGRLQEQGSLFMQGNRPEEDSFLTTKFRQAGLNIMGRTTTPEFALCSSAENPALYVTRNPWNRDYTTLGYS